MAADLKSAAANTLGRANALVGSRRTRLMPGTRIGGPAPYVLAIVVSLVLIAAGAALALASLTEATGAALEDSATVQIIAADRNARVAQTRAAAALLRDHPAVEEVRVVAQEELEALLEPWLGGGAAGQLVPIPALIDVRLVAGAADDLTALERQIVRVAPSAVVDPQAKWLAPVLDTLRSLRWLALASVLLLAFTGLTAVWLTARNAMQANAQTIEIVHLLGGDDQQIARVFQQSILPGAILASIGGFLAGAGVLLLMADQFSALDPGLLAGVGLDTGDWLLLALIPVLGTLFSVLTARLTALSTLRRML
jgi:cell division transport system permease protein